MSRTSQIPTVTVPVTALWETAWEAFFVQFREELDQTRFGDVRPTHGCVFRFVRDDGMRLTRLAELAGMTKQSVGEIVDDLVGSGYVERVPDPVDKRAKLICLTEKGREAQTKALELFAEVENRWAERYGAERIEQMRELMEEIVRTEAPGRVPELEVDA